jgi:hypothetical protein
MSTDHRATQPSARCSLAPVRARLLAAVKFPRAVETAWLLSSTLGFFLDVFVYHTFSLFLKSVIKLRTCLELLGC